MEKDFVDWLIAEMNARGWNNSELARRAGVVPSTISMVVSRQKRPGLDLCVGIASALHIPPEDVLRSAGLIPPMPGIDEDASFSRTLEVMKKLTPDERQAVLEYAIWRYERQQGE